MKTQTMKAAGAKKACAVGAALLCAALAACPAARAGFVEEFVDEASQMTNVTQSGVMQAGALNVVTGGGFVFRAPRK